jgi:hypothetical protein
MSEQNEFLMRFNDVIFLYNLPLLSVIRGRGLNVLAYSRLHILHFHPTKNIPNKRDTAALSAESTPTAAAAAMSQFSVMY